MKLQSLLFGLFTLIIAATTRAATFTVVNTNATGAGSLRGGDSQCERGGGAARDPVRHFPGDGPHVIVPESRFETIVQPVLIDGFTQTNASPNMLAVDNDNVREYFENGAPRISVVGEFHAYSAEAGNSALGVAICFDCARLIRNRNIDTPRVILGEARGDGRNGSKWHQTCQIPAGAKA